MYPASPSVLQVSFLEKKVTELENDSLASGGLKSKLKLENVQLVHRSGAGSSGSTKVPIARGEAPVSPTLSHLA